MLFVDNLSKQLAGRALPGLMGMVFHADSSPIRDSGGPAAGRVRANRPFLAQRLENP